MERQIRVGQGGAAQGLLAVHRVDQGLKVWPIAEQKTLLGRFQRSARESSTCCSLGFQQTPHPCFGLRLKHRVVCSTNHEHHQLALCYPEHAQLRLGPIQRQRHNCASCIRARWGQQLGLKRLRVLPRRGQRVHQQRGVRHLVVVAMLTQLAQRLLGELRPPRPASTAKHSKRRGGFCLP